MERRTDVSPRLNMTPGVGLSYSPIVSSVSPTPQYKFTTHTVVLRPQRPHIANSRRLTRIVARLHVTAATDESVEHLERRVVRGKDLGQIVPERCVERRRRGQGRCHQRAVRRPRAIIELPLRGRGLEVWCGDICWGRVGLAVW